jgi:hypothetical protein
MRPLFLALLLLAPAASARADDGGVQGRAVYSIEGCKSDKDSEAIRHGVEAAVEKAGTCLKELNPKAAEKILKGYSVWQYRCGYSPGGEGGHTDLGGPHKATITMTVGKTGNRQYGWESRVFHEMLHAVDTDYKLAGPPESHNTKHPPNTDAIYGCQLACFPDQIGANENEAWQKKAGQDIPEAPQGYDPKKYMDADYAYMASDKEFMASAEVYAGLCAGGKSSHRESKKALSPSCLAGKIADGCPKGRDQAFCADDDNLDSAYCRLRCTAGGDDQKTVNAAIAAADKIVAAVKEKKGGLSGEPASLLKQLIADKALDACNK